MQDCRTLISLCSSYGARIVISERLFQVKIGKARDKHTFTALVPITHVCRGNIATNAIAISGWVARPL